MNQKLCTFNGLHFDPILVTFLGHQFSHGLSGVVWYTGRSGTPILYIYSLGHFLTTKGALIDGDWGGSKKGQNLT